MHLVKANVKLFSINHVGPRLEKSSSAGTTIGVMLLNLLPEANAGCVIKESIKMLLARRLAWTAQRANTLLLQVRAAQEHVRTAQLPSIPTSPAALCAHSVQHRARLQRAAVQRHNALAQQD